MTKVLFVGDAVVSTGFARMNHAYLDGMHAAGFDVHVLGVNYFGEPHSHQYPIYPCFGPGGGDGFGLKRLPELVKRIRPDIVCVTNDPWNMAEYRKRVGGTPIIGSVAVDGKNCRGEELNGFSKAIFWTQFGLDEARLGGYNGPAAVIPLGVDLTKYSPIPREEARRGLPPFIRDAFIVGVVGRNQPRKRIDLAMIYFAEWIRSERIDDAYLMLHVAPTGDVGFDVHQLGRYLGITNRLIVNEPDPGFGVPESAMRNIYSSMDVGLNTSQAEGWALCTMEGMACAVAQIVPDWAALSEWPEDAAIKVPCTTTACTPNNINVIGGVIDKKKTIEALSAMYHDAGMREALVDRGLDLVSRDCFRWENIGKRFAEEVDSVLSPMRLADVDSAVV